MYHQSAQAVSSRRSGRYRPAGRARRSRGPEQVRLIQLLACLALFLTIFVGKGIFPQKMDGLRKNILTLISSDFNFREALTRLGGSLAGGDWVLSDFGAFCAEVFGAEPAQEIPAETDDPAPPQPVGLMAAELQFFGQDTDTADRTVHYAEFSRFGLRPLPKQQPAPEEKEQPIPQSTAAPEEPVSVPAAGTLIAISDYSGDPLPNNYTMDQFSLGDLETMTPVMGRLTSDYGYREHPINKKYLFHGGVDIGGQTGDSIVAFAAGTVEYTGKNDAYGLYLQVDHGNGVKSFYAHCSRVVVTKGQRVDLGEKVAEIGSTGNSTGPHLHLELKYNKMHLNPAYYVEFLEG